ncbi:hypothetical protein WJX84_002679 [Apatococcus fuscideae]|uniref:DNA polymerase delta small subunit n=1 Tax=Apatococcus fuscideae TaxID=2026836 RepID=A0AAW1TAY6_9CHLO
MPAAARDGLETAQPLSGVTELTIPPDGSAAPGPQTRLAADYESHDDKWQLQEKDHSNQYAHIYFARLQRMRPRLVKRCRQKWPQLKVVSILAVPEGVEVVVIGTVYKDMKLKPSILDEYVKDRAVGQLLGHTRFTSPDDTLILEDESARMPLTGEALQPGTFVTGVVMAVRGTATPETEGFHVQGVCFAGLDPARPLPQVAEDKYVAFVSGLGVGDEGGDPLRLALIVDYLTAQLGSAAEQSSIASKVVRLVMAGGLMHSTDSLSQATTHVKPRQQAAALAPLRETDMCLTELAGAMHIDVMAGAADPTNHSLPQQPLHRCLFPGASSYPTFHRVTNPHEFTVDGVHMLGTSGQNVDDVAKYSTEDDRLQILDSCLAWAHLVPTGPDTLTVYPFKSSDPFVMNQAPHVMFVGNQPKFQTGWYGGGGSSRTRLICIPKLKSSGMLILLNLRTLDVHPIHFETHLQL